MTVHFEKKIICKTSPQQLSSDKEAQSYSMAYKLLYIDMLITISY